MSIEEIRAIVEKWRDEAKRKAKEAGEEMSNPMGAALVFNNGKLVGERDVLTRVLDLLDGKVEK